MDQKPVSCPVCGRSGLRVGETCSNQVAGRVCGWTLEVFLSDPGPAYRERLASAQRLWREAVAGQQAPRKPEVTAESLRQVTGPVVLPPRRYAIDFEIFIASSGTLEIQPGTELLFGPNGGIRCQGRLLADGTAGAIHFTAPQPQTQRAPRGLFGRLKALNQKPEPAARWRNILIENQAEARLVSCTIEYGGGRLGASYASETCGGGLYVEGGGSLLLNRCLVRRCQAQIGGGVYLSHCRAQVTETVVRECGAIRMGGGVFLDCSAEQACLRGCVIECNEVNGHGGFGGAGLAAVDCPAVNLRENRILGNVAHTGAGGGLYLLKSAGEIIGNEIVRNCVQRGTGGAMLCDCGSPVLSRNTLTENRSRGPGTALRVVDGSLRLEGNIIRNNHPSEQPAICCSNGGCVTLADGDTVEGRISQL